MAFSILNLNMNMNMEIYLDIDMNIGTDTNTNADSRICGVDEGTEVREGQLCRKKRKIRRNFVLL